MNSFKLTARSKQKMFDASFESAVGKAIVAVTGHCLRVNAAFASMLGYSKDQLVGMHFADITFAPDIDADMHLFAAVMRGDRESYQLEKRYVRADGALIEVLLSATCVRSEAGMPCQFIAEVVDLTERNQGRRDLQNANALLRKQVITDHVTGLYNRRGFDEALSMIAEGEALGVLLIDMDNFKRINDRLGHSAGDMVLVEVARRLRSAVRDEDVVARLGGDEFGVFLVGADPVYATKIADRIVSTLADNFQISGLAAHVGASVGIACLADGADRAGALRQADAALYAAKRAGRGRWQLSAEDREQSPTIRLPSR